MPGQVIRAIKKPRFASRLKKLAATYSRGIYKTTTIGNAAFHGRVRNGNGWDHCFMTTRKIICVENPAGRPAGKPPPGFSTSFKELRFLENYTQNAGLQFAN